MLTYQTYKILHFAGLVMVLVSLGALIVPASGKLSKRFLAITHGLGMLLLFVAGFGMMAKLQIHWPVPTWITLKIGIWLALGAFMGLIPRLRAKNPTALFWGIILLSISAAYLALNKPI